MDKKSRLQTKSNLHPLNKHRHSYNFDQLVASHPPLKKYLIANRYNTTSIDFSNNKAVKALNKALLMHFYNISYWDIPELYLCPPVPGRADYIHYIANLLGEFNSNTTPIGPEINCLDIGVGANCIYPIIGCNEYGWTFTGADIDPIAVKNAQQITEHNTLLKDRVTIKFQSNKKHFFEGIIHNHLFDLTICNPPFHSSEEEANSGNIRKTTNLNKGKKTQINLNFGGRQNELWCQGGEITFIRDMIKESKDFGNSCFLFSTLVSKQSNLKSIYKTLETAGAAVVKTINMAQGNKTSRIVAWSFLTQKEQKEWAKKRWRKL